VRLTDSQGKGCIGRTSVKWTELQLNGVEYGMLINPQGAARDILKRALSSLFEREVFIEAPRRDL
jgi:hypothetical protein